MEDGRGQQALVTSDPSFVGRARKIQYLGHPAGAGDSMKSRTYVIAVRPGGQTQVTVLGPRDTLLALAPGTRLPDIVRVSADWLLALAEDRPLPPGAPPPVVISPQRDGSSFIALVTDREEY